MRGKLKVVLTVFCLALVVCLFTACFGDSTPTTNGIELYEGNKKITNPVYEYQYGEELDVLNNLKVKEKYSDNTSKDLKKSDLTTSVEYNSPTGEHQILSELPKKGSPIGGYTINLKYKSFTAVITISILPNTSASGVTYTLELDSDTLMHSTSEMTYSVKGDGETVDKEYVKELKFISKSEFDKIEAKQGDNAVKYCYEQYKLQDWESVQYQSVGEYYAMTSVENPLYATEYTDATPFSITPYLLTITQNPTAFYEFKSYDVVKGITLEELNVPFKEVFSGGEYTAGEGVETIGSVFVSEIRPLYRFVDGETVVTCLDSGKEYDVVLGTEDGNISSNVVKVTLTLQKGKLTPIFPYGTGYGQMYSGEEISFVLDDGNLVLKDLFTLEGDVSATDAGTYTLTINMAEDYAANYEWDYHSIDLEQYCSEHEGLGYSVVNESAYSWLWTICKANRSYVMIGEEGVYTYVKMSSTFRPCRAGTNYNGTYVDVKLVLNFKGRDGDTIDSAYGEDDEFTMEVSQYYSYIVKDDGTEGKRVEGIKLGENVYLRIYVDDIDLATGMDVSVTLSNAGTTNYNEFDWTQNIHVVKQDGEIPTTNTGFMFVAMGTLLSEIPTPDASLGTAIWYDATQEEPEEIDPTQYVIDEICMLTLKFTANEGMEKWATDGEYSYLIMPYMQDYLADNTCISWTDTSNNITYDFAAVDGEFTLNNDGNSWQQKLVYVEELGLYELFLIKSIGGQYEHEKYVTPAYCSYLLSGWLEPVDFITAGYKVFYIDQVIFCMYGEETEEAFGEEWDKLLVLNNSSIVTRYWTNGLYVYKTEQKSIDYNPEWPEEEIEAAILAADAEEDWYTIFEMGNYSVGSQEEGDEE